MQIRINPSFGPAWEITRSGDAIAAAHKRADAEAFAAGQIDKAELTRRNKAIENDPGAGLAEWSPAYSA
jgi:hypothetical protein